MLVINKKIELLDLMNQALVITPNNRLSASLLHHYFNYKVTTRPVALRTSGESSDAHSARMAPPLTRRMTGYEVKSNSGDEELHYREEFTLCKPQCMPYNQALSHWFEHLRFNNPHQLHPNLLNTNQCRYLWQNIIKETPNITYSEGLLNAALQAWTQCEQWQVDSECSEFLYTPQTQTFQSWWNSFNQRLKKMHTINEHQLVPYLIKNGLPCPKIIIWVSFDGFTPQQSTLHNYLQEQGVIQYRYDLENSNTITELYAAENTKEEYQQLIHWLGLKLDKNEQRIGVVVPELEQEARSLKRLFNHYFDPALFNISLGEPLSTYPLIAHALCWLDLQQDCSAQQVRLLLQSPFIKAAKEEFIQRAQYLQDSTLLQQAHCSLTQLVSTIKSYTPLLAEALSAFKSYPSSASPHEWISLFQHRLNSLGFPGDLGLNSLQYQCHQRLLLLFDEFRQLSLIHSALTAKEALSILKELAHTTIFQAQKQDAPIQILGFLEASGCEFDSLWVMGLTDHCLPAKTQLSAFIPPQLQRDLEMPHSTATRELHFAKQTLQRLQRGSKSTVFSYPRLQGDRPQLPSALINQFPSLTPIASTTHEEKEPLTIPFIEEYILPLKPEESLSGGSALLANQAKCPFKAFAEHRLRAKPALEQTEGIDNKERGKIIHKVMELLWHDLKSQAQLLQTSAEELDILIDKAITEAQKAYLEHHHQILHEVEYKRLKRLVLACLTWEKERPPFVVTALEEAYTITLAGLEIKVRVDRLDKVADKTWVIDYKSTLPSSKPWNEDRPQEPQLLLYALLNEEINTLLFMQIKTGTFLCSGLSEAESDLKGITPLKKELTWLATREYWRHQLTTLVDEINSGYCPPRPINPAVCTHCDFKNLCRIKSN